MPHREINVLRVNPAEETENYRGAVAQIITNIQRDYYLTHIDIAKNIGVSTGTIANAANKRGDLSATSLSRLGQVFGASYLDPYIALINARVVPLEASDEDPLPAITGLAHKLSLVHDHDALGGVSGENAELAAILPDLEAVGRAVSSLAVRIRKLVA